MTGAQILAGLEELGIHRGDGLLVHSALQFLGKPEGGVGIYYTALCAQAGIDPAVPEKSAGTLAVPAFTLTYAREGAFDLRSTPSQGMGIFSEYVRQQTGARRTPHPLQSLAVIGRYAADLAGRDTASAFDPGSAFERMLQLDFKLLLLGADIQAVSMVHYSEQRARVPYRYWKDFTGPVRIDLRRGWEQRTYRMYARDLELDPRLDLSPIQILLQDRGQWRSTTVNYGRISLCRLADFVSAADDRLAEDPWALVDKSTKEKLIRKPGIQEE